MINAVIFDYNRTLVQGEDSPPNFFPEAPKVLQTLKERNIKMAVVSVGRNPAQRLTEFEQLGLRDRGISVFKIVRPDEPKDLQPVLAELQVDARVCVVVGDRIRKEIIEGNKVGATTVWFRNGKFAEEEPNTPEETPDYTIDSLDQLIPIIDSV